MVRLPAARASPSAGDNVTSKSISAPSNAKCDLWEQNVYGDQSLGRDGR